MNKSNIFSTPSVYIEQIQEQVRIPKINRRTFPGKSLASVFLTEFCDAGCAHCFFKSGKDKVMYPQEQCEFSDYGLERLIDFINASNNGYLMVIGGGEPFKKIEYVNEIVRRAKTDRIVLVTNGMWGQSYENAKKVIFDLYDCYRKRETPTKVVLRISVDKWHAQQIGYELVDNIINVFKEHFINEAGFELQLHTLIEDPSLEEIAKRRKDFKMTCTSETSVSDNEVVQKISPHRYFLTFDDGYTIQVGMARFFHSTLKLNLKQPKGILQEALDVFDDDMVNSSLNNPSIIKNKYGILGLNFWVNSNGNVTLWGNQQLTDLKNLYVDTYEDLIRGAFDNVISYAFLDKGYIYRVNIINEVNPIAVLRSRAINIRDYAGASILEEKKTVLYYGIRVIQDYLKQGTLNKKDLGDLSPELLDAIFAGTDNLKDLYTKSSYTIISEYMKRPEFVAEDWLDLFTLIRLGHYDVSDEQIQEGIDYYNQHVETPISSIEEAICDSKEQYYRLNRRLNFMKPEAMEWCKQN